MKKTAALALSLTLATISLFSLLPAYILADNPPRAPQSSPYGLLYSAWLGGSGEDGTNAVATDDAGNIYVTGQTLSASFTPNAPVLAAAQVFVAKINSADGAVEYVKIFGGSNDDRGTAIAAKGGYLYVTGSTDSADFYTTANVIQPQLNRFNDAFAVKLNASTGEIIYATYLGGYQDDFGTGIAADSAGNAYITGVTYSDDLTRTNNALQGIGDAFVTKLNSNGSNILYSAYLGGSGEDGANAIDLDSAGNVYLTGVTYSEDFPQAGTPLTLTRLITQMVGDAFVSKLSGNTGALLYSTYLGGSDLDEGTGLFVANANTVYLTGITWSNDFPASANAFQTQRGGLRDAFIVKLNTVISTPVYATYLGGSNDDYGVNIIANAEGFASVAGSTSSRNFSASIGAFSPDFNGATDAFFAKFNPTGRGAYVTYLGGSKTDKAAGISPNGNTVWLAGSAQSANFPVTGASSPAGEQDAFVTKFSPVTPTTALADTYIQTSGYHYPAPGHSVGITLRYGNYGQTKSAATLTATLDSRLQYLGDNSGLPVSVSGSLVSWQLPEMNFLDSGNFEMRVQTPNDPINTRYTIAFTIAGAAGEGGVFTNTDTFEIVLSYHAYLPVIFRNN